MKTLFPILTTLLVLAVNGCASQVDVEAERAALRQADAEHYKAAAAKDVERMVSMYADGASMFPPNGASITGTEGVRKFASEFTALPGFAISFSPAQVEVSEGGDMGYTLSTYEYSFTGPDGQPVSDRGRDFHVWRKQPDGSWKVVIDIWNSEQPAASE